MNPFPNVVEGRSFFVASDATPEYNCIAWAVRCPRRAIWPDERGQLAWPDQSLERSESLAVFKRFFELAGYGECATGALEPGKEKIAVYAKNGLVTHAARQLPNGRWTSKMGQGVDAEHLSPDILCGAAFGAVELYMRRPRSERPPVLPPLSPPPPLILRP